MNNMTTPDTSTLAGKIAVMQAALEGKKIQARHRDLSIQWDSCDKPRWDWMDYDYRIAFSSIATGHNPDKLTEEQVGVADGWRLLSKEEVAQKMYDVDFPETQVWKTEGGWSKTDVFRVTPGFTIRTQRPPGYFLPKQPTTVPWDSPDDVPGPVCYLRLKDRTDWWGLIHTADCEGLKWGRTGGCDWSSVTLFEHSTDRRTWKPCTKEVQ